MITAAAAAYFCPYLYTWLRMPRLAEDMEDVVRDYRTLDRDFPFDHEKDTMLTNDQVARFNACRDRVMGFMKYDYHTEPER